MNKFIKTVGGKFYIIWSNNVDEETYHGIPESDWLTEHGGYDPDFFTTAIIPYDEVSLIQPNIKLMKRISPVEKVMDKVVVHTVKLNGTKMEVVKNSDYQELKNKFDLMEIELDKEAKGHYDAVNRSGENSIIAASRKAEIEELNGRLRLIRKIIGQDND